MHLAWFTGLILDMQDQFSAISSSSKLDCMLRTVGGIVLLYVTLKTLLFIYSIIRVFLLARYCGLRVRLNKLGSWAVVTGSTDGIGKAYAKRLAKDGLNIVLISRSAEKLKQVAMEIVQDTGVMTKCIVADFGDGPEIYERIKAGLDGLDIAVLVNNVGTSGTDVYGSPQKFHTTQKAQVLRDAILVNCGAVTLMTHLILPHMLAKNKGAIVNISSISARFQVGPTVSVYTATKCFISSFTRSLQIDLKSTGLTVQLVEPGYVKTNIIGNMKVPLLVSTTDVFARSAVSTIGLQSVTTGLLTFELLDVLACHWPQSIVDFNITMLFRILAHHVERQQKTN